VSLAKQIPESPMYNHFLNIAQKHNVIPIDANGREVRAQNIRFEVGEMKFFSCYSINEDFPRDDFLYGIVHFPKGIAEVVMSNIPLKRDIYNKPYGKKYEISFWAEGRSLWIPDEIIREMEQKYESPIKDHFLVDSL
jgi:hypothetical protein